MINFKYLAAFLDLSESLSFSKTSAKLNIAQSAVSRQIKQLEEQLNTQLFIRDKHSVQLTQNGQKFYSEIKHHYSAIESRAQETISKTQEFHGDLSIGMLPEIGKSVFFPMLSQLKKKHPHIIPKISYITHNDIHNKLKNGEIDFGISSFGLEQESFRSYPIFEENIVMVSRFGLPDYQKMKKNISFIGYKEKDKLIDAFNKSLYGRSQPIHFSFIVNNHQSIVQQLLSSDSYAVLPLHTVKHLIKKKKLQLASKHKVTNTLFLSYRDYEYTDKKTLFFKDFILKEVKKIHS